MAPIPKSASDRRITFNMAGSPYGRRARDDFDGGILTVNMSTLATRPLQIATWFNEIDEF